MWVILSGLFFAAYAGFVHAYLGPGIGGGALLALGALLLALVVVAFGLLLVPLRIVRNFFRRKAEPKDKEDKNKKSPRE